MVAVMIRRVMIRAGEGLVVDDETFHQVSWPQITISVAANSDPKICIDKYGSVVLVEDDMSSNQIRRLLKLPESMVSDRYYCSCVACR